MVSRYVIRKRERYYCLVTTCKASEIFERRVKKSLLASEGRVVGKPASALVNVPWHGGDWEKCIAHDGNPNMLSENSSR